MNKLSASLLVILAAIAGIWLGAYTQNDKTPALTPQRIQGAIYPEAPVLSDFNLQNHLSQPFHKSDLLNHWSLIFIGYTHCPDICPTTLSLLSNVVERLQKEKIKPPQVIFLTIDPERDTPQVLKPYIEYFNSDFTALTGSMDEVTQLSKQLHTVFRKAAGASGDINNDDYLMEHSSALMLINPKGNLQAIITAPHSEAIIIEAILRTQAYFMAIQPDNS